MAYSLKILYLLFFFVFSLSAGNFDFLRDEALNLRRKEEKLARLKVKPSAQDVADIFRFGETCDPALVIPIYAFLRRNKSDEDTPFKFVLMRLKDTEESDQNMAFYLSSVSVEIDIPEWEIEKDLIATGGKNLATLLGNIGRTIENNPQDFIRREALRILEMIRHSNAYNLKNILASDAWDSVVGFDEEIPMRFFEMGLQKLSPGDPAESRNGIIMLNYAVDKGFEPPDDYVNRLQKAKDAEKREEILAEINVIHKKFLRKNEVRLTMSVKDMLRDDISVADKKVILDASTYKKYGDHTFEKADPETIETLIRILLDKNQNHEIRRFTASNFANEIGINNEKSEKNQKLHDLYFSVLPKLSSEPQIFEIMMAVFPDSFPQDRHDISDFFRNLIEGKDSPPLSRAIMVSRLSATTNGPFNREILMQQYRNFIDERAKMQGQDKDKMSVILIRALMRLTNKKIPPEMIFDHTCKKALEGDDKSFNEVIRFLVPEFSVPAGTQAEPEDVGH
jgi:hypothetical protein